MALQRHLLFQGQGAETTHLGFTLEPKTHTIAMYCIFHWRKQVALELGTPGSLEQEHSNSGLSWDSSTLATDHCVLFGHCGEGNYLPNFLASVSWIQVPTFGRRKRNHWTCQERQKGCAWVPSAQEKNHTHISSAWGGSQWHGHSQSIPDMHRQNLFQCGNSFSVAITSTA